MNTTAASVWQVGNKESRYSDAHFISAWRRVRFDLERRALMLMKGNQAAAEELVSDTALKALLYIRRMPTRVRSPDGFMFMVLNHVYLDRLRYTESESRVICKPFDADEEHLLQTASLIPTPARTVEIHEMVSSIVEAVKRLPSNQRQLFELKFEKEFSYPTIAKILHIKEPLARKRVELLRRKLRLFMDRK